MTYIVKDLISIYDELQNKYISLLEQNNLESNLINKYKEEEKIKLLNFISKIRDLKLIEDKPNKTIKNNSKDTWWCSNFGK